MSLLDDLNEQQRESVEYCDGPLMVIAGAGSGKTRVITYKIAYLIKECGIAPRRIFAATFTNKAAGEMRQRVTSLLGIPYETPLNIATFHSLSASILRREAQHLGLAKDFIICDEKDQLALVKACLKELNIPELVFTPAQAADLINQTKMRLLKPEEILPQRENPKLTEIFLTLFQYYHRRLRDNNALDFEDLIGEFIRLLKENDAKRNYYQQLFQYILVDEFQDTNYSQYELIKLLTAQHRRICVVGDEDQSIYSWRGAELDNLLGFAEDFPEVKIVKLEHNYRSTGNILEMASRVISNNKRRLGKWLWTDKAAGEPVYLIEGRDELDEAQRVVSKIEHLYYYEQIPLSEIAIFYRQSSLSRLFEDKLRQKGLPYRVVGGIRFYDRAEIKDLTSYLRVVMNPHSTLSLQRIINRPPRGIGEKTISQLLQWADTHNISLYQAMQDLASNDQLPSRAASSIKEFLELIGSWQDYARTHPPDKLLERILKDTDYVNSLGNPKQLEVASKIENIGQLLTAIKEFLQEHPQASLAEYLEAVALATYADELRNVDAVSLMTIHCAKGLEFRVVFLVGLDEPIFPSHRTLEETGDIEEERRLFYVGITRCKEILFLSRAHLRTIYGRTHFMTPSRFLKEIPPQFITSFKNRQRSF